MDTPFTPIQTGSTNLTDLGLVVGMDAGASTPPPNEVGNLACGNTSRDTEASSPRLVIRGENHSDQPNSSAAFVDWLNCTFRYRLDGTEKLMELDALIRGAFGFGLGENRRKGHLNYEQSWELGNSYGIFATGGNSVAETSFIGITGHGCSVVRNWADAHAMLARINARITRVDLAHDDYEGRIPLSSAVEWFLAGDFSTGKGRPPSGQLIDDFGSGTGKTLYVGNRKNGKLLRIYEKGKQLGDANSAWVRWELELHNKDREIPLDTLLRPGQYLAAAYPCTEWISEQQCRIKTARQTVTIGLDVLLQHCRKSYGKYIWTLHHVCGHSADEILAALAVEGLPSRINLPIPGET